jgi:glycosyltransferase involved in cell wall biosynthesis
MRYLSFSLDNRAITCEEEGHSSRWHRRLGQQMEQVDVLVECRRQKGLQPKFLADNVRVLPVFPPTGHLYPFYALRVALAEHRKKPYDVAASEDPFRPGLAAAMFRRLTGVPFCAEYHTECFFNREWLERRPAIHRVYDWTGRRVICRAASVRCVNRKNAEQIRALCPGQPDKPIEIWPVPSPFFSPETDGPAGQALRRELLGGQSDDGPLLLFVGRIEPIKRVDRLVRLVARLVRERPGALLAVVGDGSELERCRALATSLGCDRVRFVGYVSEAKVFHYCGAADYFVNTADVEPFGRVYVEAMSAGVPVVSTRDCGAVESGLIEDGRTGLIFDPGDEEGLYRAMARLAGDPALRREMSASARVRVREQLGYDAIAEGMIALLQKTIERGRAGF